MIKELGYLRVAAARPLTIPANIQENTKNIKALMKKSSDSKCDISVYPELSLTSYNCGELFRQQVLLDAAYRAVLDLTKLSENLYGIHVLGAPIAEGGQNEQGSHGQSHEEQDELIFQGHFQGNSWKHLIVAR